MKKQNSKGFKSFFKKIGDSFRSKGFRSGAYATLVSVLVIAAVIVVNMIVSAVDIRKDLTSDGKYSLTKETEELISDLEDNVTFYYLTKDGASISWLDIFFKLYEKGSKKIDFKTVDLLVNPKFAEQYTDEKVMQYSLIAVNEATGQSKYIPYEDMLLTELSIDPYTYEYKENVVGLDIEGQLNAAIQHVTSGKQINFYAATGHGELALGTEGQTLLRKANVSYQTIELMTAERIPEDCDVLYIAVPTTDYTDAELEVIREYTAAGGDLLIAAVYQEGLENFNRLLADYGVKLENGIIFEGNSNYYIPGYAYYLLPKIGADHEITKSFYGTKYVPMPTAFALSVTENVSSGLSRSVLLSTTGEAYLKKVQNGYVDSALKADGDLEGPFSVGIYVKNEENGSEAVIFSAATIFTDDYLKTNSYANADLLTNSVNYMAEAEVVSTVRTISLDEEEMIVVTASEANAIGIMFVIVIPVLLIAVGIVVLLRRKSK